MEDRMIHGLNHLLFSVSDLEASIAFYEKVFGAKWLVKAEKTAYFDLNGIWLALNEEKIFRGRRFMTPTRISPFRSNRRMCLSGKRN